MKFLVMQVDVSKMDQQSIFDLECAMMVQCEDTECGELQSDITDIPVINKKLYNSEDYDC